MSQREGYHSTPVVAEHLGLTSQMVRRYQLAYEAVTGRHLPRDPSTRSRLISDGELGLFEKARDMVKHDDTLSVKDAMRSCLQGDDTSQATEASPQTQPSKPSKTQPSQTEPSQTEPSQAKGETEASLYQRLRERLSEHFGDRLSQVGEELQVVRGGLEAVQAKITEFIDKGRTRDERLEHLEKTVAEQSDELAALREKVARVTSTEPSPTQPVEAHPEKTVPVEKTAPVDKVTPVAARNNAASPPSSRASHDHTSAAEKTHRAAPPQPSSPRPTPNSQPTPKQNGSTQDASQQSASRQPSATPQDDRDPLWLVSWLWKI